MSDDKKNRRRLRGDGSTYLRGKIWWLKYYVKENGRAKCVCESAETSSEVAAEKKLKQKVRHIAAARERGEPAGPDVERTTIGDLAMMVLTDWRKNHRFTKKKWVNVKCEWLYLAVEAKRSYPLDHVARYFDAKRIDDEQTGRVIRYEGGQRLARITTDKIDEFIVHRQAQGASTATVNRSLAALRHGFKLAWRHGASRPVPRSSWRPNTMRVRASSKRRNLPA